MRSGSRSNFSGECWWRLVYVRCRSACARTSSTKSEEGSISMNSRIRFKRCNRVLAKTSMFTMRLEALLRRYPDCKLVYVIRDPVEVIPSGMSLLAGVLENGYDVWNRTRAEDQQRWLENLYQASCEMLRSFHEAQSAGLIPRTEPLHSAVLGPPPRSRANASLRHRRAGLEVDPRPANGLLATQQDLHVRRLLRLVNFFQPAPTSLDRQPVGRNEDLEGAKKITGQLAFQPLRDVGLLRDMADEDLPLSIWTFRHGPSIYVSSQSWTLREDH